MQALVYEARNTQNGKRYIGVTSRSLAHRRKQHEWHADAGKGYVFQSAIRKYGSDAFAWSVLETFPSYKDALRGEVAWIQEVEPEYNLTLGGQGANGLKRSEESKKKNAYAAANKSPEWKAKVSAALKGRTISPLGVAKMVARVRAGGNNKQCVCLNDLNIYPSVKHAAKFYGIGTGSVAASCRGVQQTTSGMVFVYSNTVPTREAADEIISERGSHVADALVASGEKRRKPVMCVETGEFFGSVQEAADKTSLHKTEVSMVCRGITRHAHGLRFVFVKNGVPLEYKEKPQKPGLRRRVRCEDDGLEFESLSAAARHYGISSVGNLAMAMSGKSKRKLVAARKFAYVGGAD